MKKFIMYAGIAAGLFGWLLPLTCVADQNNLLLTIPPIIAATSGNTDVSSPNDTCTDAGAQTVTWEGREWQRCDDGHLYNLVDAKDYCDELVLGGYADWYLPSKNELKSIVVCTNGTTTPLQDPFTQPPSWCGDGNSVPFDTPTIDDQFLCRSEKYWSSTSSGSEGFAYHIHFADGGVFESRITNTLYVRCVRQ